MTESIIQPEPFPKGFCMFDITVVLIDLNTSSMPLSLIFISAFSLNKKCDVSFYHRFLSF